MAENVFVVFYTKSHEMCTECIKLISVIKIFIKFNTYVVLGLALAVPNKLSGFVFTCVCICLQYLVVVRQLSDFDKLTPYALHSKIIVI